MSIRRSLALTFISAMLMLPGATYATVISFSGGMDTVNPSQDGVYGWAFDVNSEVPVNMLAFYDGGQNGLMDSHQVGIWNPSGALVATATIPAGTTAPLDGQFRVVTIPNVTLSSGSGYVIAATDFFPDVARQNDPASPMTLTINSALTYRESRFLLNGGALQLPTQHVDGPFTSLGYFGPSFSIGSTSSPVSLSPFAVQWPNELLGETLGIEGQSLLIFDGSTFTVDVDIDLVGDAAPSSVVQAWVQGIEGVWSNQFDVVDISNPSNTIHYPIIVNVDFDDTTSASGFTVNVRDEFCRSDALNWCTQPMTDTSGSARLDMIDELAAHEFGHLFGLWDEYEGGGVDPTADPNDICSPELFLGLVIGFEGNWCDSMMADFGPIQPRYFDDLIAFLIDETSRSLVLGQNPLFNTYPLTDPGPYFEGIQENPLMSSVPEPMTGVLVLIGMAGIAANGRHRGRYAHVGPMSAH